MALRSRYSGSICPKCKKKIMEGNMIDKPEGADKWEHVDCDASNYANSQKAFVSQSYTATKNNTQVSASTKQTTTYDADALEAILVNEVFEEEPKKEFKPTPQQKVIHEFMRNGKGHGVIKAGAGAGKTTTIEKGLEVLPRDHDIGFVAFNVDIVAVLKKRAPNHVFVSTLHSLGRLNIANYIGKSPKIEQDKVGMILNSVWPVSKADLESGKITKEQRKANYRKRFSMRDLVSIAKNILVNAEDANAVLEMIDKYNIEIDQKNMQELLETLPSVLEKCKQQIDVIDFDDMLWLPVVLSLPMKVFDDLMVDEAQDMNKCQIQFLLRSIKPNGRIFAVGDENQSLYAFRGADDMAIQNIIDALDASIFPLSVTFRCPASHVRLAQRIVPEIEARENAPEGEIISLDYFNLVHELSDIYNQSTGQGEVTAMVVCRTNGPLVRPAFECIRRGMKAVIRGKDIGANLVSLIKTFGDTSLDQFDVELGEYFEKEYQRLLDKSKELQAELLKDKVETLRFIMAEVETVPELINKIQMLFDKGNSGIVFSSVHKAKGLEAPNILILRPDLMPHPKATRDFEQKQELNCLYVALTRSKDKMYFVKGDENGPMRGELSPLLTEGEL